MKAPTIFIALLALTACGPKGREQTPRLKPVLEAVYASGYVVAQDEYEVFAQAEGYLSEKLVDDGAAVKRGDALFILEADQQSARFRLAKESYAMARQNFRDGSPALNEAKATFDASRTKMKFDSINFVRYTNLWKSRATSQAELDRMKLLYDNASADYAAQKNRYANLLNRLYLEEQNAKSQLEIAGDESSRYVVRSQVDGKVFKTLKEKGELVRRGEVVAVVGNDRNFYLQLNVDELDAHRLRPGQTMVVKVDAYPDQVFHATVSKVYPFINKQQQSVRVDATLQDALPGEFSGLALEANIIVAQKSRALVIPKTALLPGDSVWVKTDGGTKKIGIRKGIETLDEVEVLGGMDSTTLFVAL